MKSFCAGAIAAASLSLSAHAFDFYVPDLDESIGSDAPFGYPISRTFEKNAFGHPIESTVYSNKFTESVITASSLPMSLDYEAQAEHIKKLTEKHEMLNSGVLESVVYTCDDYNPFGDDTSPLSFLPAYGGTVNDDTTSVTFEGKCFQEITMTYDRTSDSSYDLTVKRSKPKSMTCTEVVLFANPDVTHTDVYFTRGTHKMTFNLST